MRKSENLGAYAGGKANGHHFKSLKIYKQTFLTPPPLQVSLSKTETCQKNSSPRRGCREVVTPRNDVNMQETAQLGGKPSKISPVREKERKEEESYEAKKCRLNLQTKRRFAYGHPRHKQEVRDAHQKKLRKLEEQRKRELVSDSDMKRVFSAWKNLTLENRPRYKMQGMSWLDFSEFVKEPMVLDLCEDIGILAYQLKRAECMMDYVINALDFLKKRFKCSLIDIAMKNKVLEFVRSYVFSDEDMKELGEFSIEPQLQSGFAETLETGREMLDLWPRFKTSPLWKKTHRVVSFVTALSLFSDREIKGEHIVKLEKEFSTTRTTASLDMTHAILDLVLFLVQRGYQVFQTGRMDVMFHSGSTYENWYEKSINLITSSKYISNPEAHGIDLHTFASDLDIVITQGKSMQRYACELDKGALRIVQSTTARLQEVKAMFINKRSAQETRRAPFVVVVEGHTEIAKTTFANMLHAYYGNLCGKKIGFENRYTRNAMANFWDGYSTSQWSLLLDDIACFKPGAIGEIDPTIRDILQINNNAPFMPDMASLDEKGAAPFRVEFVVATTNTPSLNFEHYFSAPEAPSRRFPIHVRLKPRAELRKDDNPEAIDRTKLGAVIPGQYPDWWEIELFEPKIVALAGDRANPNNRARAVEIVRVKDPHDRSRPLHIESVYDFLRWLSVQIEQHNETQLKVTASADALINTALCANCKMPEAVCRCAKPCLVPPMTEGYRLQGGVEWGGVFWSFFTWISLLFVQLWFMAIIGQYLREALRDHVIPELKHVIRSYSADRMITRVRNRIAGRADDACMVLRDFGDKVQRFLKTPAICGIIVSVIVSALAAYVVAYHALRSEPPLKAQGGLSSTMGRPPSPKSERESVWKKDSYEITSFDFGRRTLSWKGMKDDDIQRLIFKNVFRMRWRFGDHWKVANILGLGGQKFITTRHQIPDWSKGVKCQVIRSESCGVVNGNISFTMSSGDVREIDGTDLVLLTLRQVPPVKNISQLFVSKRATGCVCSAFYVGRESSGHRVTWNMKRMVHREHWNPELGISYNVWSGISDTPTRDGDCGSTLILSTPMGPAIGGIHQLGAQGRYGYEVGAIAICREDVDEWMSGEIIVEPSEPVFESSFGTPGELGRVADKSPLHYLQGGCADVVGSFSGFRAEPKTRVRKTLFCDSMVERGFPLTHGPPVMKGWRPWYNAMHDLVSEGGDLRSDLLDECASAFLEEWKQIPERYRREIHVLDDFTVANGQAGVRFIDAINKNTSAGFPWFCSKKKLIEYLPPSRGFSEPFKFCDEVMEHVDAGLAKLLKGERMCPVFIGSLKDEARKWSKIESAQTRMFMAGPLPFIFLMRKFLLTFARVVQKNKWTFECAVGMECQSVEWDILYQYLTQVDRTGDQKPPFKVSYFRLSKVAGDYKAFDKSLSSLLILTAGKMVAQFLEWAGAHPDHVRVAYSIFVDLAFAWVSVNGDFFMCIGNNPSGQALTSILNCIINCLLMRYCYLVLNPDKEVRSFKSNVAFIDYGDDNAFGVMSSVEWFNHTSISEVLESVGITYTMADKDAVSVPFISMENVQFLKRSFRFESETQTWMAPLDESSIIKSLMVGVASKSISREAQMVDVVHSANSEWFFHGREVFEERRRLLLDLMREHGLDHPELAPLETWDDLKERYNSNSKAYLEDEDIPPFASIGHYNLQGGNEIAPCDWCGKDTCVLTNYSPREDLRLCLHCGCCRFDEYDLDCLSCGRNDVCEICGCCSSSVHSYGTVVNEFGYHPQICQGCAPVLQNARLQGGTESRRRPSPRKQLLKTHILWWLIPVLCIGSFRNFSGWERGGSVREQHGLVFPVGWDKADLTFVEDVFLQRTFCPMNNLNDCYWNPYFNQQAAETNIMNVFIVLGLLIATYIATIVVGVLVSGIRKLVGPVMLYIFFMMYIMAHHPFFQFWFIGVVGIHYLPKVWASENVQRLAPQAKLPTLTTVTDLFHVPNEYVAWVAVCSQEVPSLLLYSGVALGSAFGTKTTHQTGSSFALIAWPAETNENQSVPNEGSVPVSTDNGETHQTASFFDETSGHQLSFVSPSSSVFTEDAQLGVDLGDFLSRPTLIQTFTWTESGFADVNLDPWTLFLSNPQIKNKLNNFAFLQGSLKVKVIMNAAPFYYGAMLMSYTPLPAYASYVAPTAQRYMTWSQRPHIWIYPQENAGGELTLPFLYPMNFVDVTSASDVASLGLLRLVQYTNLASANGATSNGVTLQIYAWMENVVLTGPTVKLALQGGDEYGNGPVSGPATAVAHWSQYLSRVPIIGKFAKATSIGASAVSQIAKLFGWSNVPVIEDVKPMKNLAFHDLASAHISEPTTKFLLDPKGEVSVDPSLIGLESIDELSISHIVSKESYVTSSTWHTTDAVGTLLFMSCVTPMIFDRGTPTTAGTYTIAQTPMAHVAQMFSAWRGDIIFRVKVVCSQYHRGRLRLTWDPVGDLSGTSDYTHLALTKIVDLGESSEFEFRVPYMQALPWLETDAGIWGPNNFATGSYVTPINGNHNGALTVRVLTNLSAPVDTAPVSVFIFVRGSETLEFANPRDITNKLTYFAMQGGVEPNTPDNHRYLLNYGEAIPSLRLLLRRSTLVDNVVVPFATWVTDYYGLWRVVQARLPPSPGYDSNAYSHAQGVETPASSFSFNFASMTPLAWISGAFVACRGAVRWHYVVENTGGPIYENIAIYRTPTLSLLANDSRLEGQYISYGSTTQGVAKGSSWNNNVGAGAAGAFLTSNQVQPGIGVEYPFMTNYKFVYANPKYWLVGNPADGSMNDIYTLDVSVHPNLSSGQKNMTVSRYVSAGTDFNLFFYLNAPTMYYNPSMGTTPV